jgi:hypothetical protein
VLRPDQPGAPGGDHEHLGLSGDSGEIPGTGVADSNRGVPVEQQVRHRLADHRGPSHHDRVPPGQRDLVMVEEREHRLRGGRRERGQAGHQPAERDRVRAVHVLGRVDNAGQLG